MKFFIKLLTTQISLFLLLLATCVSYASAEPEELPCKLYHTKRTTLKSSGPIDATGYNYGSRLAAESIAIMRALQTPEASGFKCAPCDGKGCTLSVRWTKAVERFADNAIFEGDCPFDSAEHKWTCSGTVTFQTSDDDPPVEADFGCSTCYKDKASCALNEQ